MQHGRPVGYNSGHLVSGDHIMTPSHGRHITGLIPAMPASGADSCSAIGLVCTGTLAGHFPSSLPCVSNLH
jgi:hypothetical protein